jgi:uridine kinase
MIGDKIVVKPHHTKAAQGVYDRIRTKITQASRRIAIAVAGESGSGKSEISSEIARLFIENDGLRSAIFHQDDYFVYPPKTNDRMRREDISMIGTDEVKMELLDTHLKKTKDMKVSNIEKPLIDYDKDDVVSETFDLEGVRIMLVEGTYTAALNNADIKVFIDRTYLDTLEHRKERARDRLDEYTERILEIEHGIISSHKKNADVVIDRNYDVA